MEEETCIAPTDEQFEAINKHAQRSLKKLLKNHEAAYGDQEHEWKFIGDLFARMIIASFMGYLPEELGRDADKAGKHIAKLAGDHHD
jgi:hypothetical protein